VRKSVHKVEEPWTVVSDGSAVCCDGGLAGADAAGALSIKTGPQFVSLEGSRDGYDGKRMTTIRVNHSSGVPVYKQIVDQVEFMIEAGQINDGDRLPSSRMLASNLQVNRNTVARAYRDLRDAGYIESRRRSGMVVTGGRKARAHATARNRAREILGEAARQSVTLGLSPEEISSLAYHFSLHAEQLRVTVAFVECNAERAGYFAKELSDRLDLPVRPLVLGKFDPAKDLGVDLVLTTFFHLSEVRRLARPNGGEVVGIVVAPHVTTLVRLAQVPKGKRVGVLYSTKDQAEGIRDSLIQSGLKNIEVLEGATPEELERVDVVVVPSEMPELRAAINGDVDVIEFGNVLDASSTRMVAEVVEELRDRKASTTQA
jgi:GntR family transcriptional regulator